MILNSKRLRRPAALFCALAMTLALCPAALAAGTPAESNNSWTAGYGKSQRSWDKPVTSYLFENDQGNLTRVEYIENELWRMDGLSLEIKYEKDIVVEDYTPDFQLISSRSIPIELDKWGGFFEGEKYNFFIFGQDNPNEDDGAEVIRVVKYDKNWNRLGHASLYSADLHMNAAIHASAVSCAEYGDVLYIRTGRTAYKSSDGLNHQSSVTFVVQTDTMTVTVPDNLTRVSHSFKQIIFIDSDNNILAAERAR